MSDELLTGHGAAASTFNVHLDGDAPETDEFSPLAVVSAARLRSPNCTGWAVRLWPRTPQPWLVGARPARGRACSKGVA